MSFRVLRALHCFVVLFALQGIVSAQTTYGTIRGAATDPSGAMVSGVAVVVRNTNTGIENRVQTQQNGLYEVMNLIPGTYSVSAEIAGFKKTVVSDIRLETASTVRVDLKMEMGDVATSVQVEAHAPVVNTEGADVAAFRSTELLDKLPNTFRGTGAVYTYMATFSNATKDSLAGARGGQWNEQIDGTGMKIGVGQSSIETIGELRVQLANDKAESGAPGGIYTTSRSGANAFHGAAYWYNANSRTTARNAFSTSVPFAMSNDYGTTFSGPIKRNRAFFFFGWERFPHRSQKIFNINVPTVAMRGGDFSALSTVIKDPLNALPFPGNKVPTARLSQVATVAQGLFWPLPNFGAATSYSQNWRDAKQWDDFLTQLQARVDYKFSDANSMFVRWSRNRLGNADYLSLPTMPKRVQDRPIITMTVSDTHILSPSLINEFRFGLVNSHDANDWPIDGPKVVKDMGLQGLMSDFPVSSGVPVFSVTGFTSNSGIGYGDPKSTVTQFIDIVTMIKGKHTFRGGAGLDLDMERNYPSSPSNAYGSFSFSGMFSGFAWADFLLGYPSGSSRVVPAPMYEGVNKNFNAFFQDDWRVSRRLTLNLGVRYDFNGPYHERNGRYYNFDSSTGRIVVPNQQSLSYVNPAFPSNLVPIVTAGEAGFPSSLFNSDKNNFTPRFGFAYLPFSADSRTVIRGGIGMYTDMFDIGGGLYGNLYGGPFVSSESFTNSLVKGAPLYSFPNAFPGGFGAVSAQNFTLVDRSPKNPTIYQWNFTLEHQAGKTGFQASYIGTGSRNIMWQQNINQVLPSLTAYSASRQRFPSLQSIIVVQNGGSQQAHNFTLSAERRLANGLFYEAGWTWAKNLSDVQNNGDSGARPENSYQRTKSDVGFTPLHRLAINVYYDLPFGPGRPLLSNLHGLPKHVLGGWTVTSYINARTGSYFSPSFTTYDVSNTNTRGGLPDRIAHGNLSADVRGQNRWFDASAFRVPGDVTGDLKPDVAVGRFGNTAPNILVGPGGIFISGDLMKNFSITEKIKATFYAQTRNVINHVNLNNPSSNISDVANVGRITGGSAARLVQLGLRIGF